MDRLGWLQETEVLHPSSLDPKEEVSLPDSSQHLPRTDWLSDTIVSVAPGAEVAFRHDGTGIRLDRTEPYLRLHFVSVYVRDQERSLRFFVDRLGYRLVVDARFASGNRWVEVAPPDGTAILALVLPMPGFHEDDLIGHSGLVTFITEDVEAKYKEWSERGVKFTIPPQTPAWGGKFCRFEDPDGNAFALAGFDEVTREIEKRRRAFADRIEAEQRAARELAIAKQVQARLFPQRRPPVPALDYAGVCIQARAVGGDYYDFLDLGAERLAMVLGDLAGKGMAAALLMANLQANLRSQCVSAIDHPILFLSSVNRMFFENTESSAYATLFFSVYDPLSGHLHYANCGHLPALVLRADGTIERLDATCTVLGLFDDWECSMAECILEEGDILALFTDGVTESFNATEEEFGELRLIEALRRNSKQPAHDLANAIVEEVLGFSRQEQYDDITLIIAKRTSHARQLS
jgi:serine phosphatase RsbU (regulator of sigma subunit)/predicted enzyme related to lactoylglutathione lyase